MQSDWLYCLLPGITSQEPNPGSKPEKEKKARKPNDGPLQHAYAEFMRRGGSLRIIRSYIGVTCSYVVWCKAGKRKERDASRCPEDVEAERRAAVLG